MTDQNQETQTDAQAIERAADSTADVKAIVVMFGTLILMAVHFISGFTFDF